MDDMNQQAISTSDMSSIGSSQLPSDQLNTDEMTGQDIHELADKFQKIIDQSPDIASEVAQKVDAAGIDGAVLDSIGDIATISIAHPDLYPGFYSIIKKKYPNIAQHLPKKFSDAADDLYEIAFANYIQDVSHEDNNPGMMGPDMGGNGMPPEQMGGAGSVQTNMPPDNSQMQPPMPGQGGAIQ